MPLTFAETPLYYRDSQGQYHRVLSGADMTGYRTAAAQDAIDTAQNGNLATIESSPATAAHAVGEYIVLNGQLYKVTAAIAPGVTLTVGTNISAVSGGGLNDIHDILNIHTFGAADITELRSGISFYNNVASGYVIGRLCVFNCIINSSSADIPAYTNLFRLPYHPKSETNFLVMNSNAFPSVIGFIKDTGYVQMRSAITASNYIPIFTTAFPI